MYYFTSCICNKFKYTINCFNMSFNSTKIARKCFSVNLAKKYSYKINKKFQNFAIDIHMSIENRE